MIGSDAGAVEAGLECAKATGMTSRPKPFAGGPKASKNGRIKQFAYLSMQSFQGLTDLIKEVFTNGLGDGNSAYFSGLNSFGNG